MFASFDQPAHADAAIAALTTDRGTRACTAVLHASELDEAPTSELALFETSAASAIVKLAAAGATLGAVTGLLVDGPFVVFFFTTMVGSVLGAFIGLLAGASERDPMLRALAAASARGSVLISVESPTLDLQERAEHVLSAHGGHIVHRHLLGSMTSAERLGLGPPSAG